MKDISTNDIQNNIPLVTRKDFAREIRVKHVEVGGKKLTIMAGPCTVESKTQIFEIAKAIKDAGAKILRGGVFKPLTFPYGDPLGIADSDSAEPSRDREEILGKEEKNSKVDKNDSHKEGD